MWESLPCSNADPEISLFPSFAVKHHCVNAVLRVALWLPCSQVSLF